MERQDFRISFERQDGDVAVVRVSGEIDLCSSLSFREHLTRVIDGGAAKVAVDLSQVSFIDSAGLGVLAGVARRIVLKAHELVIVCPDGRTRRVLATVGMDRVIPVVPALEEAFVQRQALP